MKAATAILCLFASHIGAQTTPDSYRVGSGISYDRHRSHSWIVLRRRQAWLQYRQARQQWTQQLLRDVRVQGFIHGRPAVYDASSDARGCVAGVLDFVLEGVLKWGG